MLLIEFLKFLHIHAILLWQVLSWLISRAAYPHRSPAEIALIIVPVFISARQLVFRDYYAARLHCRAYYIPSRAGKKDGRANAFHTPAKYRQSAFAGAKHGPPRVICCGYLSAGIVPSYSIIYQRSKFF